LSSLQALYAGFLAVPAVEWVAVGLALAYLVLAIRQNPWCWACAIASAALYSVLFVRSGLAMQAWLQVFYIGMAVYGWRAWRGAATGRPLPVQRWPLRWHVAAIVALASIAAINAMLIAGFGGVAGDVAAVHPLVPYADAGIAWASVFTTLLVARKVLENWLYWIVIDVAAAVLYAVQGLHATAALFVVYSMLAVRGYVQWRRDATLPVSANA
jgi:nicotinamide mononucleotide transporter